MIKPMLAKAVGDQVPTTPGLLYEPKWDGFPLPFRDERSSCRAARRRTSPTCSPKSSLPARTCRRYDARRRTVIVGDSGLEFDLLSNRIRPLPGGRWLEDSRTSQATPAQYVALTSCGGRART